MGFCGCLTQSGASAVYGAVAGDEFERGGTVNHRGSKRKVTQWSDKKRQLENTGVAATISEITQGYTVETCVTKMARFEPKNRTTAQSRAVGQSDGLSARLEHVGFGAARSLGSLCVSGVNVSESR
jgi:hypothetical protein